MTSPINPQQVQHIALLSRLELSEQELMRFTADLAHVLEYFDCIARLDVEGVEPMAHALERTSVLREDREEPGMSVEQALANAPQRDDPFFKVIKVLGEGGGA